MHPRQLKQLNQTLEGLTTTLPAWDPKTQPPAGHCTIEVLHAGGDLTASYDPQEAAMREPMQAGFDALTKLGYTAMVIAPPEREGQTAVLDPLAEAMVFVPQICGG